MTNMTKDYYKILDISEFSTQEEIKCAYRKLARKWHPDIAGNSTSVISKFKEINEAYEILSNAAKKVDYDRARKFYNYTSKPKNESKEENTASRNFNNTKNKKKNEHNYQNASFNWEEFISKKLKKEKEEKRESRVGKKGADIFSDVEITVFEAINGTVKVINMLHTNVCPVCKGRKFINGNECNHCHGKGETSNIKKFNVKIPAGIKNHSKIRLAGEGEIGLNGGANGDLYLTIHVVEPQDYTTDGLNILKTIQISPCDAILGTNVTVTTIKGNVNVKISEMTQNGQKIRLAGRGIEGKFSTGDMILTVEIKIPEKISEEELKLYKKISELKN